MNLLDQKTKALLRSRQLLWKQYNDARSLSKQVENTFKQTKEHYKSLPTTLPDIPSEGEQKIKDLSNNIGILNNELTAIKKLDNEIYFHKDEVKKTESKIKNFYMLIVALVVIFFIILFILSNS